MNIEKVVRVTITKEEQETLKKAEKILEEVCDAYDNGCEQCPFHNVCNNHIRQSAPGTMLYKYISALPVEDLKNAQIL